MKKFLLSIALLGGAFVAANAQLSFIYEGKTLQDGAVVEYEGYEYKGGMLTMKPELELMSATSDKVTVSSSSNIEVQMCIGPQCHSGTSITISDLPFEANKSQNVELDYIKYVGQVEKLEIPSITVEVKAYYDSDPTKFVTVTVKMGGDLANAGVDGVAADLNSVVLAGRNLKYDVVGLNTLNVYSLSGKTMVSRQVSGRGVVSLSNLPSGVYFYKLSGKKEKSAKFILK